MNNKYIHSLPDTLPYLSLFFFLTTVCLSAQHHGAWYNSHQSRIDQNRKGEFTLSITDPGGEIRVGAEIHVTLKRHAFPFGTALRFIPDDPDEEWYRETAVKYFWYGVIENDFKWDSFEHQQGQLNTLKINNYLDWAEDHGWELRGHALMWGDGVPGWVNKSNCNEFRSALKNRIERDMQAYKGKFIDYDVWNEHLHVDEIWKRCGTDLLDSAYHWAHAVDPQARLFVNEYCAVACDDAQNQALYDQVKGMLGRGVPVHGIGVQAHFFADYINAESIRTKLDQLAQLGLPIHITEFDVRWQWDQDGHLHTEQSHSDRVALFLRTVFSHPAVEAIVMWGFWDKRYWIPQSGFINEDKTAKMTADSVYNLWNQVWTTDTLVDTYRGFPVKFRGYYGTYEYTINLNDSTYTGELEFTKDSLAHSVTIEGPTTGISRKESGHTWGVFHNRFAGTFTLQDPDQAISFPATLEFYDVSGKLSLALDVFVPGASVQLPAELFGLHVIKIAGSPLLKQQVFLPR